MRIGETNERFISVEAMKPEEVKNGGCGLTIRYSFADASCGEMLLASTAKGVCYLAFVTDGHEAALAELKHLFPCATYEMGIDAFQEKALLALDGNVSGSIPLHLKGTDFQMNVWKELLKIPAGGVTSYGKIAEALQKPKACRAVGTAIGDNPVSVLIPCHRVLRADGALGGYHWGLERKIRLLEREKLQAE